MNLKLELKKNLRQIFAIAEKDVKLTLRFRFKAFLNIGAPIISIFIPFIVFGAFFRYSSDLSFDYYTANNFGLFLLLSYCILYLVSIFNVFQETFKREKFWQTLQGLIIAPFNRYNLLFGLMLANLILSLIPFAVVLTICYIFFPIPFINLIIVILIFLCIGIIFSGFGLIIGVFVISNENMAKLVLIALDFLIWFSCVLYPLEMFPKIIQSIFILNPLYYIFDLLRLTWWIGIDPSAIQYLNIYHLLSLVVCVIIIPIIATFMFNKVYNRYGIRGY